MSRKTLSLKKKSLFSAFVLLLVVGIGELACRALGLAPPTRVHEDLANWEREWNGDFYLVAPGGVINSDGLRDREHDIDNPAELFRIVCLGDSVTFGYSLPFEDSYPAVLEQMLKDQGRRVEVFNVALPGWSTRQQWIAYQQVARKYDPDHVIVGICLNDIAETQNNLAQPNPWIVFAYRHSNLVRYLMRPAQWEINRAEELFSQPDSYRVKSAWKLFFSEIKRLTDQIQRDGAGVSLMLFPFRLQVEQNAPPPIPQETIQEFCDKNHLDFIDLLGVLQSSGRSSFVDYDHLSRLGAEHVSQEILTNCSWIQDISKDSGVDEG